jgi:hypothetical protein
VGGVRHAAKYNICLNKLKEGIKAALAKLFKYWAPRGGAYKWSRTPIYFLNILK